MDDRRDSRRRSPHRPYRSREWDDRRSQDRDVRRRESRSRSPDRKRTKTGSSRHDRPPRDRDDRNSSYRHHRSSHKHRDNTKGSNEPLPNPSLPFSARPLSKAELPTFEPLLARYLELQKQKNIDEMDEREVKGRWKSFVGKWNRGELAEGWYDPEMFARIMEQAPPPTQQKKEPIRSEGSGEMDQGLEKRDDGSDDDDYGPVLPGSSAGRRAGPGIPTLQDLSLRAELNEEQKQASIEELRAARKADRALQKERLDDLVPRAEAGTRERQLEKKQMVNEKMRSFREKSPGMEVGEGELMGGGDSLQEYKRAKEREQKRKSEREIRREEIERAKMEEMEERRRAWKEREEGTVSMLKELARARFG